MKLWISSEIDADVADKLSAARKLIQPIINQHTQKHKFDGVWKSWDFICIIMSEKEFFKEISRKNKKDLSLEFRLKIDHSKFKKANQKKANLILLESLANSVEKMPKMDVPIEDVNFLRNILSLVKGTL